MNNYDLILKYLIMICILDYRRTLFIACYKGLFWGKHVCAVAYTSIIFSIRFKKYMTRN